MGEHLSGKKIIPNPDHKVKDSRGNRIRKAILKIGKVPPEDLFPEDHAVLGDRFKYSELERCSD